jgi:hypothetical protein
MPIASTSASIILAAGLGIISAVAAALMPDPSSASAFSLVDSQLATLPDNWTEQPKPETQEPTA